jgi:uncharacterized protein
MPFEVDVEELLVLAQTQAEIDAEPTDASGTDWVLAGKDMPLRELIEDELILALPYAPRHERCAPGEGKNTEKASSPFAALGGMLGDKSRQH